MASKQTWAMGSMYIFTIYMPQTFTGPQSADDIHVQMVQTQMSRWQGLVNIHLHNLHVSDIHSCLASTQVTSPSPNNLQQQQILASALLLMVSPGPLEDLLSFVGGHTILSTRNMTQDPVSSYVSSNPLHGDMRAQTD